MYNALKLNPEEQAEPVKCQIQGQIPQWLTGALIRNGGARFQFGGDTVAHLFDGMAMLQRYSFDNGDVMFHTRYVDSVSNRRNKAANRIVSSAFGTIGYPDPCKSIFTRYFSYYFLDHALTDNTAVNVMQMGDEMYAMTETNKIYRIDPNTLDTMKPVDLTKLVSVHCATAHPHQDPDGTTYNLASSFGMQCTYKYIRFPTAQKGETDHAENASILASIDSRFPYSPSYSHSFGMTENYIIHIEQPLYINILKHLAVKFLNSTFRQNLQFDAGEKARFHLIDKKTGAHHPVQYTTDAFLTFHTINAYEENGYVVFDAACYDDDTIIQKALLKEMEANKGVRTDNCNTRRFVMPIEPDFERRDVNLVTLDECSAQAVVQDEHTVYCTPQQFDCSAELPRINYAYNGQKYRYYYGVTFSPEEDHPQLLKYDIETETKTFWENDNPALGAGEPVFVAAQNCRDEDEGVILAPVISSAPDQPSFLLVLDARTFKELGRAVVPSGVEIPISFHGHYYTPQGDGN